jgi:hypothetical protein
MNRVFIALVLMVAAGLAQDKPATSSTTPQLSADTHAGIRDIQHEVDAIAGQQKDIALQFDQIQQKAVNETQRLQALKAEKLKELDAAIAKATAGVDPKKWIFDSDKLTFSAVPVPPK